MNALRQSTVNGEPAGRKARLAAEYDDGLYRYVPVPPVFRDAEGYPLEDGVSQHEKHQKETAYWCDVLERHLPDATCVRTCPCPACAATATGRWCRTCWWHCGRRRYRRIEANAAGRLPSAVLGLELHVRDGRVRFHNPATGEDLQTAAEYAQRARTAEQRARAASRGLA